MRHTFPEDFKRIDIGECNTIISFLVNSVGVWKASVFDHDEVHPDSLVCYSGYCLRKSFPIYSSYQRGWVETSDIKKWKDFLYHVLWADRITVCKGIGCSPFFLVTGAHPILPLDIQEAMWLVKLLGRILTTEELIGYWAQALAKHKVHVDEMQE